MKAYHFVGTTLRDGSPVPQDGVWLEEPLPIKCCERGLHASKHVADALKFAPGETLCLVELDGEIQEQEDKVCAQRRKIVARFDATELLRADACASALSVIHLWNAPAIVRQYLETGDEILRDAAQAAALYAAGDAAWDAARAAAGDAAWYAARAAAWDAAWDAAAAAASAARNAARNAGAAAGAAAGDAAWNAAWAAGAAAGDAARTRLQSAVDAKFAEMGVQ